VIVNVMDVKHHNVTKHALCATKVFMTTHAAPSTLKI
jgi:hypothetical protein